MHQVALEQLIGHVAAMPSTIVGAAIAGVVLAGAGFALRARLGGGRLLAAVAASAIAFQVFHLIEHLLQAGYWLAHPDAPPWITPWARVGSDVIAAAVDGRAATGNELLHLVGNLLFLSGLLALASVAGRTRRTSDRFNGPLRWGLAIQGLHVAEHVALVATWFAAGQAHGVSTLFGALTPGTPTADALRVWFHFAVNLAATVAAVTAVLRLWRRDVSDRPPPEAGSRYRGPQRPPLVAIKRSP